MRGGAGMLGLAAAIALGAVLAAPLAAQESEPDARDAERPRPEVEAVNPAVDTSRALGPGGTRDDAAAGDEPPPAEPESEPDDAAAPQPSGPGAAFDTLNLETTSIRGNQELPRVLYIVPWKRSGLGDSVRPPVESLLDETLAPIDPEVFGRQLSFYETLHGQSQED